MSYDNLSSVSQNVLKFYQQLTGEERRVPFIFDNFPFCHSRYYTPRNEVVEGYTGFTMSVRLSVRL